MFSCSIKSSSTIFPACLHLLLGLFHSDVGSRSSKEAVYLQEGSTSGGRCEVEGALQTERLGVYRRGLGGPQRTAVDPQRATLKCRLRHHRRLCASLYLSLLPPPPRRSACPAVSLPRRRSLCLALTLNLFGSGLKAQRSS